MLFAAQASLFLALSQAPSAPAPPRPRTVQSASARSHHASRAPLALERLGELVGHWSCGSGAEGFTVDLGERHARVDQPSSPLEGFTVMLQGAPLARVGVRTGLITHDPRDGRFHFDAEGRCTQPRPIEDDDDPESGVQRCLRVGATAPSSIGADGTWQVTLTGEGPKLRHLVLDVHRAAAPELHLTLREGKRTLLHTTCVRR